MAGSDAIPAAAGPPAGWLQPGAKAILCNLAKFPKLNGQVVEVVSWNEEKKRWKCLQGNGGDVNVFVANLEPVAMLPERVRQLEEALRDGHVFEVWQALQLTKSEVPESLKEAVQARLASGTYSEVVEGRLKLTAIDEKGMGYRAAKPISQGDVLLFDTALCSTRVPRRAPGLEAPNLSSPQEDPHQEMAKAVRKQVDEEYIKERILPIRVGAPCEPHQRLLRVLENSTFECTREPGRIAMFVAAARFNHSCCPSAYADATRSACVIRALRDIPEGEEVCISYVPVSDSLKKRQENLKAYGFDCDCPRCKEEMQTDPQIHVPCSCGQFSFTLTKDTRLFQTCPTCYTQFNREEAEHHLSQVAEANKAVYAAMREGGSIEELLKKLTKLEAYTKVGFRDGIPPIHTEATFLLGNLAHLHFCRARELQGEERAEALKSFHRYKKLSIDRFEEKHGSWSNQKDVDYFQVLQWVLQKEGLTEELRRTYTEKLSSACRICFGQPDLPASLAETCR